MAADCEEGSPSEPGCRARGPQWDSTGQIWAAGPRVGECWSAAFLKGSAAALLTPAHTRGISHFLDTGGDRKVAHHVSGAGE